MNEQPTVTIRPAENGYLITLAVPSKPTYQRTDWFFGGPAPETMTYIARSIEEALATIRWMVTGQHVAEPTPRKEQ